MKTQLYRHVTAHNGSFTWQLSILGHPCRTSAHFETAEEAAVSVDLVKFYLRSEFKLDLVPSLDGEQFSSLAYSRRNVILSDYLSVLKSFPEDVKDFIFQHRSALEAHKSSAPPETTASKFRRSEMIKLPAVREWVEKLEVAECDAKAFAALNGEYFFRLMDSLSPRLTDVLKPLRLALKMHDDVSGHKILARKQAISDLITHLETDIAYARELCEALRAEDAQVRSAVAVLEANRPPLA